MEVFSFEVCWLFNFCKDVCKEEVWCYLLFCCDYDFLCKWVRCLVKWLGSYWDIVGYYFGEYDVVLLKSEYIWLEFCFGEVF